MKVAIIHDWLTGMRGAEKGLEIICELFPDATLFTLVCDKNKMSDRIKSMDIRTSFLQKIPNVIEKYRYYLPFFPAAIESFDLRGYDLIISHSHCVAKSVKCPKESVHVCYCYTPMRYAWLFFDEYFGRFSLPMKLIIRFIRFFLRVWDKYTAKRVNYFISCSEYVKERVTNFYKRDSVVIYPPVDVDDFIPLSEENNSDFYLVVSAMVAYKRNDLAVEVFNESGKRLIVIGDGPCLADIKKNAKSNIEFIGWGDKNILKKYYPRCKALIFAGEEDFGIIPVEVQACGRPVIAYRKGGACETVLENSTGVFFEEQTVESLANAINRFEGMKFDSGKIREHALKFHRDNFKNKLYNFILEKYKNKNG